jgi:hypothetical protein
MLISGTRGHHQPEPPVAAPGQEAADLINIQDMRQPRPQLKARRAPMAVCYTVGYRQTTQTRTCRSILPHMAVS